MKESNRNSSHQPLRIVVVLGTRPEAIKLAPVILRLKEQKWCDVFVINTQQHPDATEGALKVFGIDSDHFLDVMREGQSLASLSARLLTSLDTILARLNPHYVIVQGDTTSAFIGALIAFYHHAKVIHIEAGLRTSTLDLPFPEEANRRLIDQLAFLYCAPTQRAVDALISEGVSADRILHSGNTVVDALEYVQDTYGTITDSQPYILVTMHRRENWGEGIRSVCHALKLIADAFPGLAIKFATHMNPQVQTLVHNELSTVDTIDILPPIDYVQFVKLIAGARLIISDSGGVVEEAPTFGVPVLIARDETERMEAVDAGCAFIVGTDSDQIIDYARTMLGDPEHTRLQNNPFGDGKAATRIVETLYEKSGF